MDLNEYQRLASQTDQQPDSDGRHQSPRSLFVPLLGLAGEVGELLSEHKKWIRDGDSYKLFNERVKEELGDLLWYLSNVASKHGLSLEDVANYNISKIQRRWRVTSQGGVQRRLLDDSFPEAERLPRLMDVSVGVDPAGGTVTHVNGDLLGEPLRDNRYEDDGYRYHDVFHLSYASVLGWSPMLRAMLHRKRKSDPRVDEVEDGGRAIAIEEGISAMVFSYAQQRSYLEGTESINYELLRTIKDMTAHLEVSCRNEADWEVAILTGYSLWRIIKSRGSARLHADLEQGTIELVA